MKIYIAGKITGDQNYAVKFAEKAGLLTGCGYTVLSPTILPEDMSQGDYLRICFAMIDAADVVFFFPDWVESEGARLERKYCEYTGKFILN